MSVLPVVSVIIPTYNCANFIKSAIDSVLKQRGCSLDLIVVDDGSTDETEDILKEYYQQGLLNYYKQKNKGSASARNLGIKKAKGEYICFLDADDTLHENSIFERLIVYENYPKIGLLCTDFHQKTFDGNKHNFYSELTSREKFLNDAIKYNKLIDGNVYIFDKEIFYDPLVLRCLIWTGTVMIAKRIFEDVGVFNENLRIAQDIELWFRIARKYEIAFLDLPTATYLLHENGVTNNIPRYYLATIKLLEQYFEPSYKTPENYKNKLKLKISSYYFNVGYYFFQKEKYKESNEYFVKALIKDKNKYQHYKYVLITFFPDAIINLLRNIRRYLIGSVLPHSEKNS